MKIHRTKHILLLAFASLFLTSCVSPRVIRLEVTATPASTTIPTLLSAPWPTEAWEHASPESQGMDSNVLVEMLKSIENEEIGIEALVVVRNGVVVLDATVFPFSIFPDARHNVYSCTKSVLSILIGIAIDEGYIEGVNQPVLTFFPEKSVANIDAHKEAMTLEHLLSMTAGLNCRDSYLYRWDGLYQMRSSPDWAQFMLDLPMVEEPGSYFEYCNGASFLLSAILQEATGVSAFEFAQEHLFTPLGISDVVWESNPQGITIGYSDLQLRPGDMAKIGYLYLNDGVWDGEQIVPSAWVRDSTRKYISATLQEGYGYQWWVDVSGSYMALGYGGQSIQIFPKFDLIIVTTARQDESTARGIYYDVVSSFIPEITQTQTSSEDTNFSTSSE